MKKILILPFCTIFFLNAQTFDGSGLGMAGNYTAISRGIDAIAWNPANLSMYRSNHFEMNFISVNAALSNSSFSVNDYNKYFTEKGHNGRWSKTDRKEILKAFSGGGLGMNMNFATNIFGFAAGNFGFGMQLIGNGKVNLKAGKPLEIFLFGETLQTDYDFQENNIFKVDMFSAIKNSLAYSYLLRLDRSKYSISHLSVGVNFNYYLGLAAARTLSSSVKMQRFDTDGLTSNEELIRYESRFMAQTADPAQGIAGSGVGLDLGVTARFARAWHFSLAVNNLFAAINWNGNTQNVEYGRIDSVFLFSDARSDTHFVDERIVKGKSFKTKLPVQLKAGLSLRLMANLKLSADWHQGLNKAFGNTTVPRIGFGAEYKPFRWLPLRSGLAFGGKDGFLFALGLGIHPGIVAIDLSYAMSKAMLPIYSNGMFTSFSFKLLL